MSSFGSTDDEASLLRSFYDASWTAGLTLMFLCFERFSRCAGSIVSLVGVLVR